MPDVYGVVGPTSMPAASSGRTGAGITDLSGKRVAFLWDMYFRGDEIFELLKEELGARYSGIDFVDYQEFGPTHGDGEEEMAAQLSSVLLAKKVDAVISAVGA